MVSSGRVVSMYRFYPKSSRLLLSSALLLSAGLNSLLVMPAQAGEPRIHAQLDCIVAPGTDRADSWIIELRRCTGELVRVITATPGWEVHFKNLEAGIYSVCINGLGGARQCESVDLTPARGKSSCRVLKRIAAPAPEPHGAEWFSVSREELAIPAAAREELAKSEEAQLRGDGEEAIKHLKRAVEIHPSYAIALNNLGTYYHRRGEYDQSVTCFKKVTELDPSFYSAWANLASSLIATGNYPEALRAGERAYQIRPRETMVLADLALCHFYLHRWTDAEEFFKKLAAVDPASAVNPHLYLSHLALIRRNKEEAAGYIKAFLAIHPNAPQAEHLRKTLVDLNSVEFSESQSSPSGDTAFPAKF